MNKKTAAVGIKWEDILELVFDSRIDSVGLNERVESLATRSIKKESKLDALNMIVSMCDLTTLEGEDTEGKISQMVAKAITPDPSNLDIKNVAAVCVYPSLVNIAKEKVGNSGVKVAAVSSYFPSGQVPMESKLLDTKYAIDSGADECISYKDYHEIHCAMNEIYNVKKKLEKIIINFISTEINWLPLNSIDVSKERQEAAIEFLETLEDDDDVQNVYSNINFGND